LLANTLIAAALLTGCEIGGGEFDDVSIARFEVSGGLPGSGDIQTLGQFVSGSGLNQALWRGNRGYSRIVPLRADGMPDWARASRWYGPYSLSSLPGSGSIQAATDTMLLNGRLLQTYWRGNVKYRRYVPPKPNGDPDWARAGSFRVDAYLSRLAGSGSLRCESATVLPDRDTYGLLYQSYLRGSHAYSRFVPLASSGYPRWSSAGQWVEHRYPSYPGSGTKQACSKTIFPSGSHGVELSSLWRGGQGYWYYAHILSNGDFNPVRTWEGPISY